MRINLKFWVSSKDDYIFHEIRAVGLRDAVDWARANVRAGNGERITVALVISDHGHTCESSDMVASYKHGQKETSCLSPAALAKYEGIDYYAAVARFREGRV